jgi:hypothetical protein
MVAKVELSTVVVGRGSPKAGPKWEPREYTVVMAAGPAICPLRPDGTLASDAGPEILPRTAREDLMFRRRAWTRRRDASQAREGWLARAEQAREWALPFDEVDPFVEPEPRGFPHAEALKILAVVQRTTRTTREATPRSTCRVSSR